MTSRRFVVGFLVLTVAVARPSVAGAQSEADRAQAKALTAEGRQLYEHGDYEGALRKFRAAIGVFPSPKIQFNIGQAYRGLARDVEALAAFEIYLSEVRDGDPGIRAEAERYVGELRQKVATVEIACDVPGAAVLIDGRNVGSMPLDRPVVVSPGPHQVVVQRNDLAKPFLRAIEARAGEVVRLRAVLLTEQPAGAVPIALPDAPASPTQGQPTPAIHRPSTAEGRADSSPIYSRWWFWTAIAGALAAGAVAFAATRNDGQSYPPTGLGTQDVFR